MNTIKILRATAENAEDISRITKKAFAVYEENIRGELKTSLSALTESVEDILNDIRENFVYIAVDNGEVLGAVRIKRLSDNLAYLYRFAVDSDENNKGIGTRLIEFAVDECRALGFGAIALHTNSRYYKLARYYYGMQFFVHSTDTSRGYIRALFVKELNESRENDIDVFSALRL
jgi:predicted N-acetyltransferase YhbS